MAETSLREELQTPLTHDEAEVTGVAVDMNAVDPAIVLMSAYPDVDPEQVIAILDVCNGDIQQAANLLADATAPQSTSQRPRRSQSPEPRQYSLAFPSCSPQVHDALDELRTGTKSCRGDSRLYSSDPRTEEAKRELDREELAKRRADQRQLAGMLEDIVDVAQHAADQSKQHVVDHAGRLKDGFALTSPVKLLAQIADRHRGTGLIPICLDKEALDQLNLEALPFLLHTAPPMEFQESTLDNVETPVGPLKVHLSAFEGRIVYDPAKGRVQLEVTEEGIHIVLTGFGVYLPACTVSWEKLTFPKLSSSTTVELRVVDCTIDLVVSASAVEHSMDLARFLRSSARSPDGSPSNDVHSPRLNKAAQRRGADSSNRNVNFTVRSLSIEPQHVHVGRLLSNAQSSRVSLLYNWLLTALKKQLMQLIESQVTESLKAMGEGIGQNAEWIPVCVLAILKGTPVNGSATNDDAADPTSGAAAEGADDQVEDAVRIS